MLLEFLPHGALSQEKTEEMLREGMEQIDRLNQFVETMRVLSGLEAREAVWKQTSLKQLEAKIRTSAHVLEVEYGKMVVLSSLHLDRDFLIIEVLDDGKGYPQGFSLPEGMHQVRSLRRQPESHHLGIGLYISRICCEKHGGQLTAENHSGGGAIARAVFQIK